MIRFVVEPVVAVFQWLLQQLTAQYFYWIFARFFNYWSPLCSCLCWPSAIIKSIIFTIFTKKNIDLTIYNCNCNKIIIAQDQERNQSLRNVTFFTITCKKMGGCVHCVAFFILLKILSLVISPVSFLFHLSMWSRDAIWLYFSFVSSTLSFFSVF